MKCFLLIVLLLGVNSAHADLQLADTDIERIVELAHDFMPGQVSAINPRDGRYYGYEAKDGNVTGYVFVSVQTSRGINGLIVAKVDGKWTVTPSIRERIRIRAYRKEKRNTELQNPRAASESSKTK